MNCSAVLPLAETAEKKGNRTGSLLIMLRKIRLLRNSRKAHRLVLTV